MFWPLVLVGAYLLGSLPFGFWFARFRGQSTRRAAAYNIGLENSFRILGFEIVGVSFVLDMLKGIVAVGLAAPYEGSELGLLAAVAAYVGHLWPPSFFFPKNTVMRGRGHVILLGILTGLVVFIGMPFWLGALPVVIGAAVLGYTGFLASGMLAGGVAFFVLVALSPVDAWGRFAALLLVAAILWRIKENLGRILERVEPRLGEQRIIAGERDDIITAAFIIHPLTVDDFFKSSRFALFKPLYTRGILSRQQLKTIGKLVRPFKIGELRSMKTLDGKEIRCILLTSPLLPEVFRENPELAKTRAIQGARLSHELGASVFGLGAFFGTVANKGLEVQAAVPEIHVTNGGAYTAGSVRAAVPGIIEHFKNSGRDAKTTTAAVVGANGVVAFGMARMIAPEVGRVILIGRDLQRLEKSKRTLMRANLDTEFICSVNANDCKEADIVFTATSDPDPVIFSKDVKPGAWIFDEGRPADVDESVLTVPGVRVIPGGVVRPPGGMQDDNGWSRGQLGFGDGAVPACLAESLMIAANQAWDKCSLGEVTKTENINYFVQEAERLGFEVLEDAPSYFAKPEFLHHKKTNTQISDLN